jgi:hypothetical protein
MKKYYPRCIDKNRKEALLPGYLVNNNQMECIPMGV